MQAQIIHSNLDTQKLNPFLVELLGRLPEIIDTLPESIRAELELNTTYLRNKYSKYFNESLSDDEIEEIICQIMIVGLVIGGDEIPHFYRSVQEFYTQIDSFFIGSDVSIIQRCVVDLMYIGADIRESEDNI